MFLQTRVQSSKKRFHIFFNLFMVRSLSFGSFIYNLLRFNKYFLDMEKTIAIHCNFTFFLIIFIKFFHIFIAPTNFN